MSSFVNGTRMRMRMGTRMIMVVVMLMMMMMTMMSEGGAQDEVSVCKRVCVSECFCLCAKASV